MPGPCSSFRLRRWHAPRKSSASSKLHLDGERTLSLATAPPRDRMPDVEETKRTPLLTLHEVRRGQGDERAAHDKRS